jgi:hypothetical protein
MNLQLQLEKERTVPMTDRSTGLEDEPLDRTIRYVERVRSLWMENRTVEALWGIRALAHGAVDSWPRSDLASSLIACQYEMEEVLKRRERRSK